MNPSYGILENCELSTTDLRRSLVQMKLAGWFDNCSGLLFGRSDANQPIDNYTAEDIYNELYEELQVPIMDHIDCGHVPPQITFINGAYAEIEVGDGKGFVSNLLNTKRPTRRCTFCQSVLLVGQRSIAASKIPIYHCLTN